MGWERVLPKGLALIRRASVPGTTSSYLPPTLPCSVNTQAEELCYPFSKRMEEDVSSLEGKILGPLRNKNQARAQEIQRVTEEQGLPGTAP